MAKEKVKTPPFVKNKEQTAKQNKADVKNNTGLPAYSALPDATTKIANKVLSPFVLKKAKEKK